VQDQRQIRILIRPPDPGVVRPGPRRCLAKGCDSPCFMPGWSVDLTPVSRLTAFPDFGVSMDLWIASLAGAMGGLVVEAVSMWRY